MNAPDLLAVYAAFHPDRVQLVGPVDFDMGVSKAGAIQLTAPNGTTYRRAVKWKARDRPPSWEALLARRYRRKLKRWLARTSVEWRAGP